jgi:hypothetical protein
MLNAQAMLACIRIDTEGRSFHPVKAIELHSLKGCVKTQIYNLVW